MKKVLIIVVLGILFILGLFAAVSCGASSPDTQTQTAPGINVTVTIEDLAFSPATITIDAGTTVTWTNQDFVNHTVTSRTGVFDSGIMSRGSSFSCTFTDTGDFEYYCTLHPDMVGHVIVQ